MKNIHKIGKELYITNDEEIKVGEKCITFGSDKCKGQLDIFQSNVVYTRKPKKIILTDNEDLIKDGVQAIENDFLEWFVKNPSCESVEVDNRPKVSSSEKGFLIDNPNYNKIIIPKEPKQETLEEVADRENFMGRELYALKLGYKLAQERSCSEEEVNNMFDTLKRNSVNNVATITNIDLFIKSWNREFKMNRDD